MLEMLPSLVFKQHCSLGMHAPAALVSSNIWRYFEHRRSFSLSQLKIFFVSFRYVSAKSKMPTVEQVVQQRDLSVRYSRPRNA